MKVTKFRCVVLLLLIASIIYGVSYVSAAGSYYSDIELSDDTELGKVFADPEPFLYAKRGQPFFMAGIVIFILWCVAIYPPNHWRRKANKIVALMLLLCISFMAFQISPVRAHEWISINVLCAGDEEFMSEANRAAVELAIDRANTYTNPWWAILDCFEETFNIHFEVLGWISWDSTDWYSMIDPRYMAAEVLDQTGFESGMEYNGHTVHMLFACTGQDIYGYYACTFPDANLTLIESFDAQHCGSVRHELSHQFYTPECDGIGDYLGCVMHGPDARYEVYPIWNWCEDCEDWINAHKYKWPSAAEHSHGGGGCPTLFVWDGEEYAEEGILDIHAESDVTLQHWIQNTLALDDGVYELQLRELDEFTSHIDQVKLYAVDDEGEWCLCPLTYAYHNELGKVKHTLRFDDDNRVDLKPTEIIDLKFAQPIPYSETEYFIFEINGYNLKPLMEAW